MKPVRIQRQRTCGFSMQEESRKLNGLECVYVGRPGKFGNPFKGEHAVDSYEQLYYQIKTAYRQYKYNCDKELLDVMDFGSWCANWHGTGAPRFDRIEELRGKNLACWCSLKVKCHADTLLRLAANGEKI